MLTLTDQAVTKINEIMKGEENVGKGLRVYVEGASPQASLERLQRIAQGRQDPWFTPYLRELLSTLPGGIEKNAAAVYGEIK